MKLPSDMEPKDTTSYRRLLSILLLISLDHASATTILIPAYFDPGTGASNGVGDGWAQMTTAAQTVQIMAIVNPNSGPARKVSTAYTQALTNLKNAGGKIIAYVSSASTNVPLTVAQNNVTTYIAQYGRYLSGFFIDEMTEDSQSSHVDYYHSLYTFIKSQNAGYVVVGNPGTRTLRDYLTPATRGADVLVTYEGPASGYAGDRAPAWVNDFSADNFAVILHTEPTTAGMKIDYARTLVRNIGYVYITDQTMAQDGPYGQLPTYWSQEIANV